MTQTRGGGAAQAAANALAHSPVSRNRLFALGLIVALGVIVMVAWAQLFVHVDSRDIVVVQYPFTGQLVVHTEAGTKLRLGGPVTVYPRRMEYSFSAAPDQGKA